MTMIRTVAPTVLAVDIGLARTSLRVDGDYLDALITMWVQGITRKLEHAVGQRFMDQTWEVRLSAFPDGGEPIELPHPAKEVLSAKYVDPAGVDQTLPAAAFQLSLGEYASALIPARGATWAAAGSGVDLVITVICGYGDTPDATPETARLYILGKLVEQFDPITRTERETVQSVYLDGLLDDLKTYA